MGHTLHYHSGGWGEGADLQERGWWLSHVRELSPGHIETWIDAKRTGTTVSGEVDSSSSARFCDMR